VYSDSPNGPLYLVTPALPPLSVAVRVWHSTDSLTRLCSGLCWICSRVLMSQSGLVRNTMNTPASTPLNKWSTVFNWRRSSTASLVVIHTSTSPSLRLCGTSVSTINNHITTITPPSHHSHSLTHSHHHYQATHSPPPLTHSLTHSLTHITTITPLIYHHSSSTHSLMHSLTHALTHSLTFACS
jgi:hypothetical protein